VHTPGHSEDHQVVWFPDTRTLFSGDLWLGVKSRVIHPSEDPYRIVESLRKVAALEPERMFDAHRGEVARPVSALLARADWLSETLATIEELIKAGRSDAEIVKSALGGEEVTGRLSFGAYSRMNLVLAVRQASRK
jgi:glyoxylase-like metal-dependent hydrolase (beta-lactamase superfamily II)